jgi:thioredoxin 1
MTFEEFEQRLRDSEVPIVVEFWAPWCMPCRTMEPFLKRMESEFKGRVALWRINADEEVDLLRHLKVFGIPTLIGYQQDRQVIRVTGAQSVNSLRKLFEALAQGMPIERGLTPQTRLLRLISGLALVMLGWWSASSLLLVTLGGIVTFSAVYDRCPVYNAIAPRLKKLLGL